jgi:hypothetical protein
MLGRVKDRILEHGRPRANQPTDNYDDTIPAETREPQPDRRRARAESPEPPRSSRQRRSSTWNYDKTPESSPEPRSNGRPPPSNTEREVKDLQRAVESERKQYLDVKHRFQQASQQSVIDPEHIQDLLNQVKVHGALLASAQRKLQRAKEQLQREATAHPQQQRSQRRPSPPREAYYESDEEPDHFDPWPSHGFGVFTTSARSNIPFQEPLRHTGAFDPLFGFRVFDRLFTEADSVHSSANGFHYSTGNTGPTFRKTSYSNTGSSPRPNRPRSYHYAPPPQPVPVPELPCNPLRATEAARLFASYNSSWNSLSATSPTIPYPTRTLRAPALSGPSTIPHQLAHTWSTEKIMQANTALFFIIALGLNAIISESGTVTFDRAATPEADVRALLSVLKKEKMRWHSDRLGRRNEDVVGGGLNEALQRDERARAVFHGVCALMEFALGREG